MHRIPRLVIPVIALLVLAGSAQALGGGAAVPRFHRGLSKAQILQTARATQRVIIVMKAQQRGRLATPAGVKSRRAVQAGQRRSLMARVGASGVSVTRRYTVLNGFAAIVSAKAQQRLEADPAVAAVIPDAAIKPVP